VLDPLFRRDPAVVQHPDCEGPPLTDEMVAAAERELGVTLPQAYVGLMRACNGGYTHGAVLPTTEPTSWAHDHVPVDSINGIPAIGDRGRFGTGSGILGSAYLIEEWGLPDGLVLLTGDGHWWIALDYRASGPAGPPTVVWLDVDGDEDLPLADSFDTFLANLVPESELADGT
jgi:hypothetical protein